MNYRLASISLAALLLSISMLTCPAAAIADDTQAADKPQYLRVVDVPGRLISLEIATVELHPAEDATGPRITLVGVAHIGDKSFYDDIQTLLDTYEIVLYEAVQPLGMDLAPRDDPAAQARHTQQSMKTLGLLIASFHAKHERYPKTLAELREGADEMEPIMANWLNRALHDAWSNPIHYRADEEGFELRSLGSDGQPGGEGHPGEIIITHEDSTTPLAQDTDNLQQQLADAFGLEFQLRALNYGASNWLPSDMNAEQLNVALQAHDVDIELVGGTLAGTSFPARMIGGLLRLVGVLDAMAQGVVSDMMKIMMIEILGDETMIKSGISQLGDGFEQVILYERNQVVIDDLIAMVRDEPEVSSIAVLYGAAHVPDLVDRMVDQMNYQTGETTWLRAIAVDLERSQLDARQAQRMRMTIRRMLQQQMRQMMPSE
jgi:hypothetical protein